MNYLNAFKREILLILKNKGLLLIFIGAPLLVIYFGGVYMTDYVYNIPIAILDEDNSSLSNSVDAYFVTNERFSVDYYPESRQEMEELIASGKVGMGLWIPPHFEKDATTFQSTEIMAIVDGSNIVMANNAYAQAATIVQTLNAGVEMRLVQAKGFEPTKAENLALVYNLGERILYDSKMTYMNYLIIAFAAIMLQQLFLSGIGGMLVLDGVFLSDKRMVPKVFGATSASLVGITPAAIACMVVLAKLFKVPIIGNMWTVTLMTFVFLISMTGPALILAAITKDRVKFSQFSFMLSMPAFVSSGCIWPVEAMPKTLEMIIRALWPLINYGKLVQEIMVKGRDFNTVVPNIIQIVIYAIVWTTIGLIIYKRAYKKQRLEIA